MKTTVLDRIVCVMFGSVQDNPDAYYEVRDMAIREGIPLYSGLRYPFWIAILRERCADICWFFRDFFECLFARSD